MELPKASTQVHGRLALRTEGGQRAARVHDVAAGIIEAINALQCQHSNGVQRGKTLWQLVDQISHSLIALEDPKLKARAIKSLMSSLQSQSLLKPAKHVHPLTILFLESSTQPGFQEALRKLLQTGMVSKDVQAKETVRKAFLEGGLCHSLGGNYHALRGICQLLISNWDAKRFPTKHDGEGWKRLMRKLREAKDFTLASKAVATFARHIMGMLESGQDQKALFEVVVTGELFKLTPDPCWQVRWLFSAFTRTGKIEALNCVERVAAKSGPEACRVLIELVLNNQAHRRVGEVQAQVDYLQRLARLLPSSEPLSQSCTAALTSLLAKHPRKQVEWLKTQGAFDSCSAMLEHLKGIEQALDCAECGPLIARVLKSKRGQPSDARQLLLNRALLRTLLGQKPFSLAWVCEGLSQKEAKQLLTCLLDESAAPLMRAGLIECILSGDAVEKGCAFRSEEQRALCKLILDLAKEDDKLALSLLRNCVGKGIALPKIEGLFQQLCANGKAKKAHAELDWLLAQGREVEAKTLWKVLKARRASAPQSTWKTLQRISKRGPKQIPEEGRRVLLSLAKTLASKQPGRAVRCLQWAREWQDPKAAKEPLINGTDSVVRVLLRRNQLKTIKSFIQSYPSFVEETHLLFPANGSQRIWRDSIRLMELIAATSSSHTLLLRIQPPKRKSPFSERSCHADRQRFAKILLEQYEALNHPKECDAAVQKLCVYFSEGSNGKEPLLNQLSCQLSGKLLIHQSLSARSLRELKRSFEALQRAAKRKQLSHESMFLAVEALSLGHSKLFWIERTPKSKRAIANQMHAIYGQSMQDQQIRRALQKDPGGIRTSQNLRLELITLFSTLSIENGGNNDFEIAEELFRKMMHVEKAAFRGDRGLYTSAAQHFLALLVSKDSSTCDWESFTRSYLRSLLQAGIATEDVESFTAMNLAVMEALLRPDSLRRLNFSVRYCGILRNGPARAALEAIRMRWHRVQQTKSITVKTDRLLAYRADLIVIHEFIDAFGSKHPKLLHEAMMLQNEILTAICEIPEGIEGLLHIRVVLHVLLCKQMVSGDQDWQAPKERFFSEVNRRFPERGSLLVLGRRLFLEDGNYIPRVPPPTNLEAAFHAAKAAFSNIVEALTSNQEVSLPRKTEDLSPAATLILATALDCYVYCEWTEPRVISSPEEIRRCKSIYTLIKRQFPTKDRSIALLVQGIRHAIATRLAQLQLSSRDPSERKQGRALRDQLTASLKADAFYEQRLEVQTLYLHELLCICNPPYGEESELSALLKKAVGTKLFQKNDANLMLEERIGDALLRLAMSESYDAGRLSTKLWKEALQKSIFPQEKAKTYFTEWVRKLVNNRATVSIGLSMQSLYPKYLRDLSDAETLPCPRKHKGKEPLAGPHIEAGQQKIRSEESLSVSDLIRRYREIAERYSARLEKLSILQGGQRDQQRRRFLAYLTKPVNGEVNIDPASFLSDSDLRLACNLALETPHTQESIQAAATIFAQALERGHHCFQTAEEISRAAYRLIQLLCACEATPNYKAIAVCTAFRALDGTPAWTRASSKTKVAVQMLALGVYVEAGEEDHPGWFAFATILFQKVARAKPSWQSRKAIRETTRSLISKLLHSQKTDAVPVLAVVTGEALESGLFPAGFQQLLEGVMRTSPSTSASSVEICQKLLLALASRDHVGALFEALRHLNTLDAGEQRRLHMLYLAHCLGRCQPDATALVLGALLARPQARDSTSLNQTLTAIQSDDHWRQAAKALKWVTATEGGQPAEEIAEPAKLLLLSALYCKFFDGAYAQLPCEKILKIQKRAVAQIGQPVRHLLLGRCMDLLRTEVVRALLRSASSESFIAGRALLSQLGTCSREGQFAGTIHRLHELYEVALTALLRQQFGKDPERVSELLSEALTTKVYEGDSEALKKLLHGSIRRTLVSAGDELNKKTFYQMCQESSLALESIQMLPPKFRGKFLIFWLHLLYQESRLHQQAQTFSLSFLTSHHLKSLMEALASEGTRLSRIDNLPATRDLLDSCGWIVSQVMKRSALNAKDKAKLLFFWLLTLSQRVRETKERAVQELIRTYVAEQMDSRLLSKQQQAVLEMQLKPKEALGAARQ